MPDQETLRRVARDKREGKAPSTQAGEFIREEMHHIREGKHGARSSKQAIAIGLSKARRSGIKLPIPTKGAVSEKVRKQSIRDKERGERGDSAPRSTRRARASLRGLRREGPRAGSHAALSRQTRRSAKRRPRSARSASARRGAQTRVRLSSNWPPFE